MSLGHGNPGHGKLPPGRETHRSDTRHSETRRFETRRRETPRDTAQPDTAPDDAAIPEGEALRRHIQALRRYAYALVGGAPIAEDLVQETLARAIFYLREGREVRNLRSYLLTMLHNVRVDLIKSDRRQGESVPIDELQHLAVPAAQIDHLQCNEAAAAIADLPTEQREVLLLIGLEGLSYQEATEMLGVPLGTVMSRLNRGRNAVKTQLDWQEATAPHGRNAPPGTD